MAAVKLYRIFYIFIFSSLIVLSTFRLLLLIWLSNRVPEAKDFGYIIVQGIRFDLVLTGIIIAIPAILTPFISTSEKLAKPWKHITIYYLSICFIGIIFLELSTPSFINQYDLRPNYLYVEYLKYPREVFSTLWTAYKFELIFSMIIAVTSGYALLKILSKDAYKPVTVSFFNALIITPAIILICLLMIRSTFDHRPVNPSTAAFSPDPLINSMPLSSAYSVLYALYEARYEDTGNQPYGKLPDNTVLNIVKKSMSVADSDFINTGMPTLHKQHAYKNRHKPLNLVIILEESLGAEYVGALGGRNITPELDSLSKQGIWFNNLYATGTRSVRGIEAVITGFTPTPSRSVVKLSRSQTDFFTIAQLLKQQNYKTSFIYGGEAHFDNMRRFFANNGFDMIVDENDYENPVFYGSWGASDEDLFNKAHKKFKSYGSHQAFFSLVFTSSNHPPFDYPQGRIKTEGNKANTINNAVRYADYALGQYIEKARESDYWKNTLFLIVADHSDKVYGPELVPIRHFRIPALILGADIKPTTYTSVASQIDLLPTVLSLMGINSTHPAIGHDLAKNIIENISDKNGRAIMQFGSSQAYMQGNKVAILQKNKKITQYTYENNELIPTDKNDINLINKALAHAIWSINTYRNRQYQPAYNNN